MYPTQIGHLLTTFLTFYLIQGKQAMSKLGAGAREAGGRERKGGQLGSNCFKVVKMIMERQLQPVIVFSFSRRDCEAYALQMSKLDFNTRKGSMEYTALYSTYLVVMIVIKPMVIDKGRQESMCKHTEPSQLFAE